MLYLVYYKARKKTRNPKTRVGTYHNSTHRTEEFRRWLVEDHGRRGYRIVWIEMKDEKQFKEIKQEPSH